MVDSRAHLFGARRKLLNDGLRKQYIEFLTMICYKGQLSTEDTLELCYYLLLMNRQDESVKLFSKINWTEDSKSLSPLDDYFIAYMNFLSGNISQSKEISLKYQNLPILRIRNRFNDLLHQINEIESNTLLVSSSNDTTSKKLESSLSFSINDQQLLIEYQNISTITVSYYMMDIEFLFSSNPFMAQKDSDLGQFSYIKPTAIESVELPSELFTFNHQIPEKFLNSNIMIEISGNGIHYSSPYFAHFLRVSFIKSKGLLQVTTKDNKPLSTTYVKVYTQSKSNNSSFYKDGYTDHRGIFDYLFLTSDTKLKNAKKLAVLLISKEHGSVIHEISV